KTLKDFIFISSAEFLVNHKETLGISEENPYIKKNNSFDNTKITSDIKNKNIPLFKSDNPFEISNKKTDIFVKKQKKQPSVEKQKLNPKKFQQKPTNISRQSLSYKIKRNNNSPVCLVNCDKISSDITYDISKKQTFKVDSTIFPNISHFNEPLYVKNIDKESREKSYIQETNTKALSSSEPLPKRPKSNAVHNSSEYSIKNTVSEKRSTTYTWFISHSTAHKIKHKYKTSAKNTFSTSVNITDKLSFYPSVSKSVNLNQIIDFNKKYNFVFKSAHDRTQENEKKLPNIEERTEASCVSHINIIKKEKDYEWTYHIENVPLFFFDACIRQFSGLKVKSSKVIPINRRFMSVLSLCVIVPETKIFHLSDLVPRLVVNYTNKLFCDYYLTNIYKWSVRVKLFRDSENIIRSNILDLKLFTKSNQKKDRFVCFDFRSFLYKYNYFSTYKPTEISFLENVKKILVQFGKHLKKIQFMHKADISCIATEIRNNLISFKENKTQPNVNKLYSAEDNDILSAYSRLLESYIPYAESFIDVYNIYLKKNKNEILSY
ncbi:hypothetical protein CDIK_2326, partial [Cucumispora dikerogammari]